MLTDYPSIVWCNAISLYTYILNLIIGLAEALETWPSRRTMQQYFIFLPKVTAATCVWSAPIVNPLTMLTINSITRPQLSGPFGGFVSRMLPEQSTRNAISSLHSTKIPNTFWHHRMRCLVVASDRTNAASYISTCNIPVTFPDDDAMQPLVLVVVEVGMATATNRRTTMTIQQWLIMPELPSPGTQPLMGKTV